jgi:hypothetical protein
MIHAKADEHSSRIVELVAPAYQQVDLHEPDP